jgi:predicted nucleic acid-binding protein
VNVFLDLMKARANAEEARSLLSASWIGSVHVFVAEEFIEELRRAVTAPDGDPVLRYASTLPRLPAVPSGVLDPLMKQLALLIFPERSVRGTLAARDHSDLIHLSKAIHHGINGFVTSEKRILRHSPELRRQFRLDVMGPAEFSSLAVTASPRLSRDVRAGSADEELVIAELDEEERAAAEAFLENIELPAAIAAAALSPGADLQRRRRLAVRSRASADFVGFGSWNPVTRLHAQTDAYVFVDEDHADAQAIAAYLLREITQDVCGTGPCVIDLRTPAGHARVRSAAVDAGFWSQEGPDLRKIAIGGALTAQNWQEASRRLHALAGLTLQAEIPAFSPDDTRISLKDADGHPVTLSLAVAERLFAPVLFLLPGRHGTLVPIRRSYAEHLFGGVAQRSLLPRREAALFSERVYFRAPTHGAALCAGSPVIFYESLSGRGRGCAFAGATITSNRLVWAETLSDRALRKGVLERDHLLKRSKNSLCSMIYFDNILLLPKSVPLMRLRALGAVDGANLVAPRKLNTDILGALLTEAHALVV